MRCLALNASFEPLTMVPTRRALRLVIEGKAEIVEADGEAEHGAVIKAMDAGNEIGFENIRLRTVDEAEES